MILHSMMKNNRNTHQGAPHAGKQTCACASDLGDASHVTCMLLLRLTNVRGAAVLLQIHRLPYNMAACTW